MTWEPDECGQFQWVRIDHRSLPAIRDAQSNELLVSMRMVAMKFLWPMAHSGLVNLEQLFDPRISPVLELSPELAARFAAINKHHCACEYALSTMSIIRVLSEFSSRNLVIFVCLPICRFGEFSAEQCLAEDKLISVQNFEEVYTGLKPMYQEETLLIVRDPLGGPSRIEQLPPSEANVAKVHVEWLTLGNVVHVPCVERLGVKFLPLYLVQQGGGLFKDLAFSEAFPVTREERCAMDLLLHASGHQTVHVPFNSRLISYDMVRVLTPLLPAGDVELTMLNPSQCANFMQELPAPPATADAASASASSSASASNAAPIPAKSILNSESVSATRTAAAASLDTIVLDDSPSDPEAELDLQAPESEPVPPATEASSLAARDQVAIQTDEGVEPGIIAYANGGVDAGGETGNAEESASAPCAHFLEEATCGDAREFEDASALASAASPNNEYASAAASATAEGAEAVGIEEEEEETQARLSVFQLFNECLGRLSAVGREPEQAGDATATPTSPEKPRKKEMYLLVSDVAMALAEYGVTDQMLESHLQTAGLLVQPTEEERARFCELDQVDHLDPHETMARIQSFRYVLRLIDEKRGC